MGLWAVSVVGRSTGDDCCEQVAMVAALCSPSKASLSVLVRTWNTEQTASEPYAHYVKLTTPLLGNALIGPSKHIPLVQQCMLQFWRTTLESNNGATYEVTLWSSLIQHGIKERHFLHQLTTFTTLLVCHDQSACQRVSL